LHNCGNGKIPTGCGFAELQFAFSPANYGLETPKVKKSGADNSYNGRATPHKKQTVRNGHLPKRPGVPSFFCNTLQKILIFMKFLQFIAKTIGF